MLERVDGLSVLVCGVPCSHARVVRIVFW